MGEYDLSIGEINLHIERFLTYVYGTAISSEHPEIHFIVGGPGAGKSSLEVFLKKQKHQDRPVVVNSDKIAEFHPKYDEIMEKESFEAYTLSRKFVRPATPIIFDNLRKNRINIINENVFNKGESDIEFVQNFKDAGYKTFFHILATDKFLCRLYCFEREVKMLELGLSPRGIDKDSIDNMYNAFIPEIKQLESLGLCNEVNVYNRGKVLGKPDLIYSSKTKTHPNFVEALYSERGKQRKNIFEDFTSFITRIDNARFFISENGINPLLTQNAIDGLNQLKDEFILEYSKTISKNGQDR